MRHFEKDGFYLTVDILVFAGDLEILLIKRKNPPFQGSYAIPGGFVDADEDFEDAARRELEEETGVRGVDLIQMESFGDLGRDPRGRTVTIPYIAHLDDKPAIRAGSDAEEAEWFPVNELPKLAFDHEKIIKAALRRLRHNEA